MAGLLTRLKRHPLPVAAWFERVVAVSFALPVAVLRPLVPEPLAIDTHEGVGFVTVALVWTRGLRPEAAPRWLGQDFFLAGYRVFVSLRDQQGRRMRGLKILRSETDRARMVFFGNLLTHYNYRKIDVEESTTDGVLRVVTRRPDGALTLDLAVDMGVGAAPTSPPEGSPFADWTVARRFAGPMPYTFDDEGQGRFIVIEGRREEWHPRPVRVVDFRVGMFDEAAFAGSQPVPANAFAIEGVPYLWKRGRLVSPSREPAS